MRTLDLLSQLTLLLQIQFDGVKGGFWKWSLKTEIVGRRRRRSKWNILNIEYIFYKNYQIVSTNVKDHLGSGSRGIEESWMRVRFKAGPPPLEAILVIFGRRALIFFVWKLLGKNEKWHHFYAHAQWWSPWRRKNVEKGTPLRRI